MKTKHDVVKDKEKRTCNGIVFDSMLEMKYYRDVILPLMDSGDIVSCELQIPYELQEKFTHDGKNVRAIVYIADFVVTYKDGRVLVIDTKGCPDTTALLKRKLFWYKYPDVDYVWITYCKKFGGWIDYEDYKKFKREEKKNAKLIEKEI